MTTLQIKNRLPYFCFNFSHYTWFGTNSKLRRQTEVTTLPSRKLCFYWRICSK